MVDFYSMISDLQNAGFFDILLPMLLVFVIIFATLEKTKIFGTLNEKPRTNINTIVAIIIALVVIVQFDLIYIMNLYLSKMALFIIIALIFMLTLGIFGADPAKGFSGIMLILAVVVSLIAVFWALSPSMGFELPYWLYLSDEAISWLLAIGFFVLVIVFVNYKPKTPGFTEKLTKAIKGLD